MTCIRNWLEYVLFTLSSDCNSLQQALTVTSGTSTIHSVSHILFSRPSFASGFSSRLRTYSMARARSSGVEGPRILAAEGTDAAVVRTIRTAKILLTIMPSPLKCSGGPDGCRNNTPIGGSQGKRELKWSTSQAAIRPVQTAFCPKRRSSMTAMNLDGDGNVEQCHKLDQIIHGPKVSS